MDLPTHDLPFDGPGAGGQAMAPAMALALQSSFGSLERWRETFVATGLLSLLPREGRLVNQDAADRTRATADAIPLLVLDLNGGTADAFMRNIPWADVYLRYQQAVEASSEALGATREDLQGAHVLDVRRAGVFEQADTLIAGATWRDPQAVDAWAATLPRGEPVVVYCVYGHEVGRSTAMRLQAAGVQARFLRGGIDGWKAAGGALQPKAKPL